MKLFFRGIFPVFNYMAKRDDHIVSLAKHGDLYYMILDLGTYPTAYVTLHLATDTMEKTMRK